MKGLLALLLISISMTASAEVSLPAGCQVLAVQGELVRLKLDQSSMIFIHNLTQSELWITRAEQGSGASVGWSSRLQANHWSALVIDKTSFNLSCIESKPGHEQQIPCEGSIAVCQIKKFKIPEKNQATFWAGEDQPLSELTASLSGRGFVLPTKN